MFETIRSMISDPLMVCGIGCFVVGYGLAAFILWHDWKGEEY